ncbi:XdhC family protein [Alteribacillus sp. YIM 98480]|uniref:XdhC family protein n=1 Tax=Alteribacillus sp. YIM 98480 TaxID=2606599 RepID=UPI0021069CEC|nr:XdhC family protein [Alteribacillus sp. YIM 98480]
MTIGSPPDSYVLVMTHNFQWDQSILSYFIHHRPLYLGVLGPRRRTKRLLSSDTLPQWISSPVGVDIQGEGAEEISVSIAAELIQVKNSRMTDYYNLKCMTHR